MLLRAGKPHEARALGWLPAQGQATLKHGCLPYAQPRTFLCCPGSVGPQKRTELASTP